MTGTQTNNILAGSGIILGIAQMLINMHNANKITIDEYTYPYLYLGIITSFIWLMYQYKNGSNYFALYSSTALFSQVYILYKLSSKHRERIETK